MAHGLKHPAHATADWVFDRRKAKRLFLYFPIEISGVDREGQPFLERTKTEDISEIGCRLDTKTQVRCGDVMEIKLMAPPGTLFPEEAPHQFEVMWVKPTKAGWSVGARKIQDGKIWKVTFPPPKTST